MSDLYKRASDKLIENLYLLKGQWFYRSDASEICGVNGSPSHADYRKAVGQVLYNWSHKEPFKLEQKDKRYWVIENEFKVIKPSMVQNKSYDLRWPDGGDSSFFSFTESAVISEGDCLSIAGEGNIGKTVMAIGLAVANCDIHPVTLVVSENVNKLDSRIQRIDWASPYTEDGDWKFEVIEEKDEQKYLDIVRARKDNLVIIDWLDASKDAYLVGQFYKAMSERLGSGVGVAIQQKRSYKDTAQGGEAYKDYCSVALLISKLSQNEGRLMVDKVKDFSQFNPNGYEYSFEVTPGGGSMEKIHEIKKCRPCRGSGRIKQGVDCPTCWGKGYVTVYDGE